MSNLRDIVPDRTCDTNKPSTSAPKQHPNPFKTKLTSNNIIKQRIISPGPKLSPKHNKAASKPQDKDESIVSRTFTNSTNVSDLNTQCQQLNINSTSDVEVAAETIPKAKKKNARKKLKYKQLLLQMPQADVVQSAQNNVSAENSAIRDGEIDSVNHDVLAIQELFMKKIAPLYSASSTRYLENMAHHPHFQYMHGIKPNEVVPHHSQNREHIQVIQNETTVPRSPQYLQNMLQHPLLSQSLPLQPKEHIESKSNQQQITKNPRRRKRRDKPKVPTDGNLFESYITLEEAEEGLKNKIYVQGVLRINPKQFQHSYVPSNNRDVQDILIDGIKNRNRAFEGDLVVVEILPDEEVEETGEEIKIKKCGKVVYIKEKLHSRTCIGTLKLMPDRNHQKALFIPRDHRIPRLNIPFTSWPDNFYKDSKSYENTIFSAKIVDWQDIRFALGTIIRNIGQSGDLVTEIQAILAANDLDVSPFGPEVRHLYPRLDYIIPDEEIALREDCRDLCTFSIDPSSCRDIDDALSCKVLENGNYEIGVHISDVAHFLKENTILDEQVADKATTVYLVEKAYHMLPEEMCLLCSLFPGIDKLTFSVFWEITSDGKVLNHRFAKTVVQSCSQLAYEHAQLVLDGVENCEKEFPEIYGNWKFDDIHKTIKILGEISSIFRKNRFSGGALRIDQPKVCFRLNAATGLPDTYSVYESQESHQLIEEFMLLANMTVAQRINDDHPELAFLRCHPPPSNYMMRELAKSLKPMGIDLDISTAGSLYSSIMPHVGPDNDNRGKAMVLNMLCAKPMTRAKYFCAGGQDDDEFAHYALNVPLYTHFTSPIRRYADIMVHRLLAASLKYRENPTWEVDHVRAIAAQCNKQKYNAKKAGEMCTEMYTLKYIEMHSPVLTEAVVVDIREKYIDVIIVAMGLNRRVFFNNDFPGKYNLIKNDAGLKLSKMEVIWPNTNDAPEITQIIEVFSVVNVEMFKCDDMVKVETRLVKPT